MYSKVKPAAIPGGVASPSLAAANPIRLGLIIV